MKNFLRILWAPIVVFCLQLVRRQLLPTEEWMDMIAHFLGGMTIAWMAYEILRMFETRRWSPKLPWFLRAMFFIGFVAIVGIVWEFHEYLFGEFLYGPFVMTIEDTLLDLALDLGGGVVVVCIFLL